MAPSAINTNPLLDHVFTGCQLPIDSASQTAKMAWPIMEGRWCYYMDLLSDTQNCGLRMRRECWERFARHRFQRKPLVSDPDFHHDTCVTHVPWCMSVSLTHDGEKQRSRHTVRMRNHQFYVPGKRPMAIAPQINIYGVLNPLVVCPLWDNCGVICLRNRARAPHHG